MELLGLRYYCAVVEAGSFAGAAKRFGVGVSNMSQMMKQIERETGLALFERYPNRVKVSESGRRYYEQVKSALDILDNAAAGVSGAMDLMDGNINICINTNRRIVTDAINAFHSEFPEVTFTINHKIATLQQDESSADRSELDYDLIIADALSDEILDSYEKELLLSERILLATDNKNKILRHKRIPPRLLAQQDFITLPPGYSLYNYTNTICRAMGFSPKISIKCDDAASVRTYIEMGFGVSFVPEISWRHQFSDTIVLRDIGDFRRETYLYLHKHRRTPRRMLVFMDFLQREFEKNSLT